MGLYIGLGNIGSNGYTLRLFGSSFWKQWTTSSEKSRMILPSARPTASDVDKSMRNDLRLGMNQVYIKVFNSTC